MDERSYENDILDEAERMRRHTEKLERIESDRQIQLAKISSHEREHRRHIFTGVLVGIGVLLIVAMCFAGCTYQVDKCIDSGGVWDVDHCAIPE